MSSGADNKPIKDECTPPLSHMTPYECLVLYKDVLTEYEKKEIKNYSKIYYVGREAMKHAATRKAENNFGFDEAECRYRLIQFDHIAYRYQIISLIGQGSYGCVIDATDHVYSKKVALKIIRNENRFHRQALKEIQILKLVSSEDPQNQFNCIRILDSFLFRKHICIVFPLFEKNLYQVFHETQFKGLNIDIVRIYTRSILQCLAYLKKLNIIHCDIKPENIVVSGRNRKVIKVIDFGSSCFVNEKSHTYIQSRFYRSPEVLLEHNYNTQVDMWSLACLMFEMAYGKPLFAGEDEKDQMACIIGTLGLPPNKMILSSSRRARYFDKCGLPMYCPSTMTESGNIEWSHGNTKSGKLREAPGRRNVRKLLPSQYDDSFFELLFGCLKYDPDIRLWPAEALYHPWITNSGASENTVLPKNGSQGLFTHSNEDTPCKQQTIGDKTVYI